MLAISESLIENQLVRVFNEKTHDLLGETMEEKKLKIISVNTMMKNKNISGQTGQSYRAMLSDASLNRSIV